MNIDIDDTKWLLTRIKWLEDLNSPRRLPTHRNIWQGCYDVWMCKQDEIDAVEIPRARMKTAEESGLIESKIIYQGKYNVTIWALTELGKLNSLSGYNPNDLVLVYIGTHGTISTSGGCQLLVDNNYIYGSEIKSALSKLDCQIILIIDACHSGAMLVDWPDCPNNVSILCSCQKSETAGNWILTNALLSAIDGNADYNNDHYITIEEISIYITEQISTQHPAVLIHNPIKITRC